MFDCRSALQYLVLHNMYLAYTIHPLYLILYKESMYSEAKLFNMCLNVCLSVSNESIYFSIALILVSTLKIDSSRSVWNWTVYTRHTLLESCGRLEASRLKFSIYLADYQSLDFKSREFYLADYKLTKKKMTCIRVKRLLNSAFLF